MDEAVVRYYRRIMRGRFENFGSLENPTICVDSLGKDVGICGEIAGGYLNLYVNLDNGRIVDFKYQCACDPVANVAVEILAVLLQGKSIEEAKAITAESFQTVLGGPSPELVKRAKGLLELLHREIRRYQGEADQAGSG